MIMDTKCEDTLKVSGFPKCTCTRADLYKLFSSVAQVNHVWVSSEKNWTINGCHLKVSKCLRSMPSSWKASRNNNKIYSSDTTNTRCRPTIDPQHKKNDFKNKAVNPKKLSTYKDYQNGRNTFWEDIPHHKTSIAKSKKVKPKKKCWERKYMTPHAPVVQTCKKQMKWKTKKSGKRKKSNFKLETYTAMDYHEKNASIKHSSFEGKPSCLLDQLQSSDAASQKHAATRNCGEVITEMDHSESVKMSGNESFCQIPTKKENTFKNSKEYLSLVPVYVHSNISPYVINLNPVNALDSVQEEILKKQRIPKHLQHVIYQGHRLDSEQNITPYSSVQLIVKGNGGMKNEEDGEGIDGGRVECFSSEDDIGLWLKKTVKVQEETLAMCQDLDGDLLYDFEIADYRKFAQELCIPIGQAFRILSFRDRVPTETIVPSIKNWSVSEVIKFVQGIVKEKDDQKKMCEVVDKDKIDGLLFHYCSSLEEFQTLFIDSKCKDIVIRKLFKRKNDFGNDNSNSRSSSLPLEDITTENSSIQKGKQEGTVHDKSNESSSFDKKWYVPNENHLQNYCYYVKKVLSLNHCKRQEHCIECKLWMMCNSDLSTLNPLEKKFGFFVLCKPDDFRTPEAVNTLWQRIFKKPRLWISNLLSEKDCEQFQETNSPEKMKYQNEDVTLSKSVVVKCLMEKGIRCILGFENSVLLINRGILKDNVEGYFCCLDASSSPELYFFNFDQRISYWLFDPDDYAFGFRRQTIPLHKCGTLEDCAVPVMISTETDETMENFSNKFGDVIESVTFKDSKIISSPGKEDLVNNSNVDNVQKSEEFLQISMHQQPLLFEKIEKNGEFVDINVKANWQSRRRFKEESDHIIYHEGFRFIKTQSEGTLCNHCVEYKLFIDQLDGDFMEYFLTETMKFACGCLNSRINGTIYFGISDKTQTFKNITYRHGEIVGFPLMGMDDYQIKFTDRLKQAIQQSFMGELSFAAGHCTGNPVFVEVTSKEASPSTFVMEVDISPNPQDCKDLYFKLNLGKLSKKSKSCYCGYIRDGSATKALEGIEEQMFSRADLPILVKKFKQSTGSVSKKPQDLSFDLDPPVQKLKRLLLRGGEMLDNSLWPILILGKPSQKQKEPHNSVLRELRFIKRIKFVAVFDFDDCSNKNGLCKLMRNEEMSILQTDRIFFEHSGNHSNLQEKLDFPKKLVWIFANGRNDGPYQRPYLKQEKWMTTYSSGVNDAIVFFSKDNVIQNHRNLVVVLLFSTQFDGLYDTFISAVIRFSWEKLVIICENLSVFQEFEKLMLKYNQTGFKVEQLKERSVIGVPWKQINAMMNDLTGFEDDLLRQIPTSNGGRIPLDERFENSLSDLTILGSRECESKTFENAAKRSAFAHKKEIEFYKGSRVSWWNFYFETHVLRRSKFSELREKIHKILTTTTDSKVVSMTIVHEPGAGATTLARHLLWDLRGIFRCALVNKITENTWKQVLNFRKYEEINIESPKPVLLVVDEIEQGDILWYDLERKIYSECRNISVGIVCCIIILQREEKLTHSEDKPVSDVHSRRYVEYLRQKLDKKEQDWLESKYLDLEKKLLDFKAEHLLSFMIMRSDFNVMYIKSTIKHLLRCLDIESNEFKLLKYMSLIAVFAPCSRSGPKSYIPLECCDELMGFKECKVRSFDNWWEQRLSNVLKILLIIEDKHNASGKLIRIAHSSLASVILQEVQETEKIALSDLVVEYLNSSLFQTSTHGKKDLIEISKEMLNRRMKEEYDDEITTSFSPIIEEIRKDSSDKAEEILILGFEQFEDPVIAQSLARLLAKRKKYDDAIKWAKHAVHLSPKVAYCFFYHTLGSVLKDKFTANTTDFTDLKPGDAVQYLKTIQDALNSFLQAVKEVMGGQDNQVLYSYVDIIRTINLITRFTFQSVELKCGREHFKRYFVDKSYIPDELQSVWKDYHEMFKDLQITGQKVFDVLENYINFNATFYERSSYNGGKRLEHRSYRMLKLTYPVMLEDFARTFGCDKGDLPPSFMQSDQSKNIWHRQRVLRLNGYSYYKIFNILARSKKPDPNSEIHVQLSDAVGQFLEIKKHLTAITEKNTRDMISLVCVNMAIGLLDGRNRDPDSFCLKLCQRIIDINKSDLELAHFFTSVILWPSTRFKVRYSDETLKKSLKFLSETNKKYYKKQRQKSSVFVKEDRNISQPSTQFFLTNENGVKSICYKAEVFFKEHPESKAGKDNFWDQNRVKRKLRRLQGHLKYITCNPSILMKNDKEDGYIEIHKVRGGIQDLSSEEEVSFYLGFSTAGPIAYDVKPLRIPTFSHNMDGEPDSSSVEEYRKKSEEELKSLLRSIHQLKQQHPSRIMKKRDKQLLKDEHDIKTALDLIVDRSFEDFD